MDNSRLLARFSSESVNSLYVIHNDDVDLADRLVRALANLDIAPRVVALTAKEPAAVSERLAEHQILEHLDALIAYRIAT